MNAQPNPPTAAATLWRFAKAEFDDARFVLRVSGVECDLQMRPLQVLQLLLRHAGEVVTREEIFDAVWGHRHVADSTLNSLISRLRRALEDDEFKIIGNVARVGYKLGVPVFGEAIEATSGPGALSLKVGQPVPGQPGFILAEPLGTGEVEVWLAHEKRSQVQRVFKFALDGPRLSSLKREVTLARVLKETLGERQDLIYPIDWNFETTPFFIELSYGGRNLIEWAQAQGGIGTIALERRIQLLADIAETVAAAHGAGVLHKDLKPANVLIDNEGLRPRVVDFGCGQLLDPERLAELKLTRMGFTREEIGAGSVGGTPLYVAPEVLNGQVPTTQADVYALGVMLYQLCVGELQSPITPGWQRRIDDDLLREDIEAAAHGEIAQRLASAAELATRLRSLPARRVAREQEHQLLSRASLLQQALEAQRARRPWVISAIVTLAFGLIASTGFFLFARQQREEALRQQAEAVAQKQIAVATRAFLRDDVMRAANPDYQISPQEVTINEAIRRGADKVAQRFAGQPLLEAEVRSELGSLYNQTTEYKLAEAQFNTALELFAKDSSADPRSLALARYRLAQAMIGQSDYPQARHWLDVAGDAPVGDPEIALARDIAWGNYLYRTGNSAHALPFREQAIDDLRALDPDDVLGLATAQIQLANIYRVLHRDNEAEQLATAVTSHLVSRQMDNTIAYATALALSARLAYNRHDYAVAESQGSRAAELVYRIVGRDTTTVIEILSYVSAARMATGQYTKALLSTRRCYDALVALKNPTALAAAIGLAHLDYLAGNESALPDFAQAVEDYRIAAKATTGRPPPTAMNGRFDLADDMIDSGDPKQLAAARELITSFELAIYERDTGEKDWPQRFDALQGRLALLEGDKARAAQLLEPAIGKLIAAKSAQYEIERAQRALVKAELR